MALRADERRDVAISFGGEQISRDPEMSEWGNPHEQTSCIHTPIHNVWKGTRGTETSKYPDKRKKTRFRK